MSVLSREKTRFSHKYILRLLISVGALLLVYNTVSFDAVLGVLTQVSLKTAVLLLVLYLIGQVISSYKWCLISWHLGSSSSYVLHLRAYFIGMFANTSGLGTLGGDATRALLVSDTSANRSNSLISVIADRLHGLLVLMIIGAGAVLLTPQVPFESLSRSLALILIASILPCLWLSRIVLRRIPISPPTERSIGSLLSLARAENVGLLVKVTVISALFHSLQIIMHYLMLSSLQAEIALLYLFAVIPIVNILTSLPLSLNGLGIRETAYLMFLVPAGMSVQGAAACGAIWFATVTIAGLLGGMALLMRRPRQQEIGLHFSFGHILV